MTTNDNDNPPELNLETVVAVTPDQLSDEQKNFLNEHQGELTDEQKETYKDVLTTKKEGEEPEEKEPETRYKSKEKKGKDTKEKGGKEQEEEEEEVDSDDLRIIGKVVDKKLSPIHEKVSEIQKFKDEREVNEFLSTNPEYGKYKTRILKYMAHEAYKNIPVANLAYIVAGKDLMKIGAEKERAAGKKAEETKSKGRSARTTTPNRDEEAATTDFGQFEKTFSNTS